MTPRRIDALAVRFGVGLVALTALHLALQLLAPDGLPGIALLRDFADPDLEASFPTWLNSVLWFCGAATAAAVAFEVRAAGRARWRWWFAFAALPLAISVDEIAMVHESVGVAVQRLTGLTGLLYFSWVVPAAALGVVLALVFLRFFQGLPARLQRRLIVVAVVAVVGAIGLESVSGGIYYAEELRGSTRYDSLGYLLVTTGEELLELTAALLLLRALLHHLVELRRP